VTIGFVDNDILLKLIAFNLFESAIDSLNLTQDDLRVLRTAKHVFRRKRSQNKIYSNEIWSKAIEITEQCQLIENPKSSDEAIATLLEEQQLDPFRDQLHPGETQLILATRNQPDFLLLSGDKKCLTALPKIPTHIYQRLCGRVICVEQLVLRMIEILGFEAVCDRIQPNAQYDKTIQICFGYSQNSPENQVREALQSYINDIHRLAPGLLADLN
jgi:hypothetical protein